MDYAQTVVTARAKEHDDIQDDSNMENHDTDDNDDDWTLTSENISDGEIHDSVGVLSLASNIGKRSLGVGKDLLSKKS